MTNRARVAVVGATGAVGSVTLALLRERGYSDVRAFASARSAGANLDGLTVEEATPDALGAGDLDLCLFSVGTSASRELVPVAAAGGALCIDKSSAFRLENGVPLVVPEVNGDRVHENAGIVANPNCCSIPLTIALAPLRDTAGLRRVRVATYQSVSGAGASAMDRLRGESVEEHDLRMDWDFDGVEFDEEATDVLGEAEGVRLVGFPSPLEAAGLDDVLVGRIRTDETVENGLALFLACDNLRKGAALNAIQIAELALRERSVAQG